MNNSRFLVSALLLATASGCEPSRGRPEAEPTAEAVAPMTWQPQQDLDSTDNDPGFFGWSAAVSGDTAIIGAPLHQGGVGAAHVFVHSGTSWTEQQPLAAGAGFGAPQFGWSASLSGDTAIVGAPQDMASQGAAYVFVRSGVTWAQQQQLVAADGMGGDELGWSVAVDGDTAIVGSLRALSQRGAAYVFVRSGTTWSLQQKLTNMPGDPGFFGSSVALNGDTAIVGAPSDGSVPGAAYAFVRSGTTWTQQQKLVATVSVPGDRFGNSVAVDVDTAIVGAQFAGGGMGTAHVFTRSGGVWGAPQQLATDPSLIGAGDSVAVRGDTAVVGASGQMFSPGGFQIFTRAGASFTSLQVYFQINGMVGDELGFSAALDQRSLIVGEPGRGGQRGEAKVFLFASTSGEACTSGDECFSGFCVDGVCCVVAACRDAGTCNAAEHCQAGTGICSVSPLNEGTVCDDSDACTKQDTCQGGYCTGTPTLCPPMDDCHEFGSCDPANGMCSTPEKPDGQPCSTGMCKAGKCSGDGATGSGGSGGGGGGAGGSASSGGGCDVSGSPAGGTLGAWLIAMLLVRRRRR